MKKAFPLFALVALLPSAISRAEDATDNAIPIYDVDSACAAYVVRSEQNSVIQPGYHRDAAIKGCIVSEQRNYDSVKSIWTAIPEKTRTRCLRMLEHGTTKDWVKTERGYEQYTTTMKESTMKAGQYYSALSQCISAWWQHDKYEEEPGKFRP